MKIKRPRFNLPLAALALGVFLMVYGAGSQWVQAAVSHCAYYKVYNVASCHGYFTNKNFYINNNVAGQNILYNPSDPSGWAIPASINTVSEFENYILARLGSGTSYSYNRVGAAFIIETMLGNGATFKGTAQGIQDAHDDINAWKADLAAAAAQSGGINWNYVTTITSGTRNSMHACTKTCTLSQATAGTNDGKDIVFFTHTASDGTEASHEIRIKKQDGTYYRLRRECANLIGATSSAGIVEPPDISYNLIPAINVDVDNPDDDSGIVQTGDTLTFTYTVRNSKSDTAPNIACSINGNEYASAGATPTAGPIVNGNGYSAPGTGCPRNFPSGTTTVATETYTIPDSDANYSICRSLTVNPYAVGAGQKSVLKCVIIASKPYAKIFGGDVMAGAGIGTGCTQNDNASVVGWNRENTGNASTKYAGTGAQFGIAALADIRDFASGQHSTGTPYGLSFANTDDVTDDQSTFGGSLGSLPCVTDYYKVPSGSTNLGATGNVGTLASGKNYSSTSNLVTLTGGALGTAGAPKRMVIYVKGNVRITSNITYPAGWTYNNAPLFELIVKGNIYIDPGVTQLDGAYIAEYSTATNNGTVYTCAPNGIAPVLTNGSFYSACNSKLTINGLLSASAVEMSRTKGTFGQSRTTETPSSVINPSEVINYNPSMWIVQPSAVTGTSTGTSGDYDAVTSLPPVL